MVPNGPGVTIPQVCALSFRDRAAFAGLLAACIDVVDMGSRSDCFELARPATVGTREVGRC